MQGTEVTYWKSLISNYPFAPGLSIDLFYLSVENRKLKSTGFAVGRDVFLQPAKQNERDYGDQEEGENGGAIF